MNKLSVFLIGLLVVLVRSFAARRPMMGSPA